MGDDQGDDFDVSETALITEGGGGAYNEEEEAPLSSSDGDSSDGDEEGGADEKDAKDKKHNEALLKKEKQKNKLKELKERKKRKRTEEDAVTAAAAGEEDTMGDPEIQLATFNKHQPRTESGGFAISLQTNAFFDPCGAHHVSKFKGASPFARAAISAVSSLESLHARSDEMGCPHVLVLCAGALRASHVLNDMSKHLKCAHAKVWAKHFKVPAQVEALGRKAYPVAVGTPARVAKLFELGALCANRLKVVLIDMGCNQKGFNVLSLSDTRQDTYNLLHKYLLCGNGDGGTGAEGTRCKIALVASGEKIE